MKYINAELLKERCHITGNRADDRHQCVDLATLGELIDELTCKNSEEQGLLNTTPDEAVKISLEKAEEWIDTYNAIWTLWNAEIFDDEEKACYEHNVLFKIIQEFKQGLKIAAEEREE